MSEHDITSSCLSHPGDAAAYALSALEPAEAEAFERHLEQCAVCRDELEEFQRVTEMLALAPSQQSPSRRLRRELMAQVRDTRRERARPALAPLRLTLAAGLAAVLLAAVVVAALRIAGGATAREIAAQVRGSSGSAELRLSGGRGELIVRHMPAPRPGHIYEVWLAPAHGAPRPTTALFSVTRAGAGDVAVPGSLRGISEVMVTEEPAGGTQHPTTAPIIVARVD